MPTDRQLALSEEQAKQAIDRATEKAKLVEVLSRGFTNDQLIVDLPAHLHGEWVPDNSISISEMQAKGFWVDTEYAPKRSLHNVGENVAKVGDVIHMICNKQTHELIEEIRVEQYLKRHGNPKSLLNRIQGEESEFNSSISAQGLKPIIDEGNAATKVGADEIRQAVKETL